ncbi:hypothetical protein LJC49_07050 [Ruminococcaceae bacterium OttesenSCG-928-I18]|nr:hypothetical protein [Ruminococcaceae bacterium OttesenSCG-928-I18]
MMQERKNRSGKTRAGVRVIACVVLVMTLFCLSSMPVQAREPKTTIFYQHLVIPPHCERRTEPFGVPGQHSVMRYSMTIDYPVEIDLICNALPENGPPTRVFFERFKGEKYSGMYCDPKDMYEFRLYNNSNENIYVRMAMIIEDI